MKLGTECGVEVVVEKGGGGSVGDWEESGWSWDCERGLEGAERGVERGSERGMEGV